MQATALKIKDRVFLLPDTHDYTFPTYILDNAEKLKELVAELNNSSNIMSAMTSFSPKKSRLDSILLELRDFKETTGVIGYPFTMSDAMLYAIDKNIDIVFEFDIDDF